MVSVRVNSKLEAFKLAEIFFAKDRMVPAENRFNS